MSTAIAAKIWAPDLTSGYPTVFEHGLKAVLSKAHLNQLTPALSVLSSVIVTVFDEAVDAGCEFMDTILVSGGLVSRTVTLNDAEPWFPAESCAEHDTIVVVGDGGEYGNVEPDGGVQVGVREPSKLS